MYIYMIHFLLTLESLKMSNNFTMESELVSPLFED
jgi:hypothetical protein